MVGRENCVVQQALLAVASGMEGIVEKRKGELKQR
jgi:hypothetical protein